MREGIKRVKLDGSISNAALSGFNLLYITPFSSNFFFLCAFFLFVLWACLFVCKGFVSSYHYFHCTLNNFALIWILCNPCEYNVQMLGRWWEQGKGTLNTEVRVQIKPRSSNPLKFYVCFTPEEKYNFTSILWFFKVSIYVKTRAAKTWIFKSQIHRSTEEKINKAILFFFHISWQLHLMSSSF